MIDNENNQDQKKKYNRIDLLLSTMNGDITINSIAITKAILLSLIEVDFSRARSLYNRICAQEASIMAGNIREDLLDCLNDIGEFADELKQANVYKDDDFTIYPIHFYIGGR